MNHFKYSLFILIITFLIYTSEHNHNVYCQKSGCLSYNVHDKQIGRLYSLLAMYDIEKEKLNPDSQQVFRAHKNVPSVFDGYESTAIRKDLPADFRGIFKALHRLTDSMVCPKCKYASIQQVKANQEEVKRITLDCKKASCSNY